jgi:hypothetical protein
MEPGRKVEHIKRIAISDVLTNARVFDCSPLGDNLPGGVRCS